MSTEEEILKSSRRLEALTQKLIPCEPKKTPWGTDDSGPEVIVSALPDPAGNGTVGISKGVLNLDCKVFRTEGAEKGGRTVFISVVNAGVRVPNPDSATSNSTLVLTIKTATGRQVLESAKAVKVDGSRGVCFFVNCADVLTVDAQIMSDEVDPTTGKRLALIPGDDLIVSGSAVWGQCTPPLQMYSPATRMTMVATVPSVFLPIPNYSNVMNCTSTTANNTVLVEFANLGNVRTSVDLGRNANVSAPLVVPLGGVDGYRLTSPNNTIVSPFFAVNF